MHHDGASGNLRSSLLFYAYINDDESHFVPRSPCKGLTRGAEVPAARALIRYRNHKSKEGRGFQFGTPKWKQSRPSGPPLDWL